MENQHRNDQGVGFPEIDNQGVQLFQILKSIINIYVQVAKNLQL